MMRLHTACVGVAEIAAKRCSLAIAIIATDLTHRWSDNLVHKQSKGPPCKMQNWFQLSQASWRGTIMKKLIKYVALSLEKKLMKPMATLAIQVAEGVQYGHKNAVYLDVTSQVSCPDV